MLVDEMRKEAENLKTRSAWEKGVQLYVIDLLDTIEEYKEDPKNIEELTNMMKNGADSGAKINKLYNDCLYASHAGSYLIYDTDIAERLCNPTELKRTHNGERQPNSRETWLDVQGRAVYQAMIKIRNIYRSLQKRGK